MGYENTIFLVERREFGFARDEVAKTISTFPVAMLDLSKCGSDGPFENLRQYYKKEQEKDGYTRRFYMSFDNNCYDDSYEKCDPYIRKDFYEDAIVAIPAIEALETLRKEEEYRRFNIAIAMIEEFINGFSRKKEDEIIMDHLEVWTFGH
jgi:hypothetical protein